LGACAFFVFGARLMADGSLSGDMTGDGEDQKTRGGDDHEVTYLRFMAVTKWAVVGIAAALVALALFLA
jgi:hypothetical protein